jgi:hypothetical protein
MQAYEDFPDQAELTARRLQKAVTALQRWREKYETEVAGNKTWQFTRDHTLLYVIGQAV